MLDLVIGTDSKGITVSKGLSELRNLFVSYLEDKQIKDILDFFIKQGISIGSLLLITKEINLIDTSNCLFTDTYIYNNPAIGTIKSRSKLFNPIIKNQKKKNTSNKKTLIFIDDFWQFYPKFTSKVAINHFRQLIQYGYKYNIHFVIGSILPYRNLLLQLMQADKLSYKKNIVPTLGAELIISPDDLIFFTDYETQTPNIYYPISNLHTLQNGKYLSIQ